MTIKEAKEYFQETLFAIYPHAEILALQRITFQELFNASQAELLLINNKNITPEEELRLKEISGLLEKEIPIQYIFGYTEFYGQKFLVNENVLIPRQETEELVEWIIKENDTGSDLKILDIGTGSGCIILSLSKKIETAMCFATDVSKGALEIAEQNAKQNKLEVSFSKHDILKDEENPFQTKYDIIVSNPPYVLESEKEKMQKNVLDNEPELALFVNDDNALIYYSVIAQKAKKWLNTGGRLYFEINEKKGEEMHALLSSLDFKEVEVRKDLNQKDRMVRATL